METPKVVQIAVTRSAGERYDISRLVILTDNGQVWQLDQTLGSFWPWVRIRLPWEPDEQEAHDGE